MVARYNLIVLKQGNDFTFRQAPWRSIIDLTIAAPLLTSRIGNWSVLEPPPPPGTQDKDRSSCVVHGEELFILGELKRESRRLEANTAPGIDGVSNQILKEMIVVQPEILLEVFNSCLWDGRFFDDWKKQRLVLLRKRNKLLEDASSYKPICLLDTMEKLLEELILQRLQSLLVEETIFRRTSSDSGKTGPLLMPIKLW